MYREKRTGIERKKVGRKSAKKGSLNSCSRDTSVPTNLALISLSSSLSSSSSSNPSSSITPSSLSQTISKTLGDNCINDSRDKTLMSLSMGHSNLNVSWIGGDQFKVNDSNNDISDVEAENVNVSKVIKNSNLSRESNNLDSNIAHQCHLSTTHVMGSSIDSQYLANDDLMNSPNMQLSPRNGPNFEQLRSIFNEKLKGGPKLETGNPGKSPGLMKLMQQNERRLSENLKSKKIKDSVKKLKKREKEAKFERSTAEKKKFRDIQIMFDEMSKKNGQSDAKNAPIKRLFDKGGKRGDYIVELEPTQCLGRKVPSVPKLLSEDTVKIVNKKSTSKKCGKTAQ